MSIRIILFIWVAFYLATSEWVESNLTGQLFIGIRHIVLSGFFIVAAILKINVFRIQKVHLLSLIIIIILSILNYFTSVAPGFNYFIGSIFTFLFLIIFILAKNIPFKNLTETTSVLKTLVLLIFVSSIWPIMTSLLKGQVMRYNFGIYREVGAFGSILNFGVILSLALFLLKKEKRFIYLAFFLSFGVFLTILKKTLLSNLITWILFLFRFNDYNNKIVLRILFVAFLFIIFFFVGQDILLNINQNSQYLSNVGSEGHVRLGMYIASINIANDYFPFGSGFSSFGSLTSIANMYSPLYENYGVSEIGANSYQDVLNGHHTLLDTFWPHIIAELGYFGLLFFLMLWFYPTFYVRRLRPKITNARFYSTIYFITVSVSIVYFWEGFTLYTPETPLFVFLHSGLVGMLVGTLSNNKVTITV